MSIKARPFKVNIRLTNQYDNVIKFNYEIEKNNYFDTLEPGFYNSLDEQPEINFNIGDTINTTITLDVRNFGSTLNQALNFNYLVVKDTNFQKHYLYYFITNAYAKNLNVVVYTLELDVMTTYNINKDYNIENFLVDRCHIDRFTPESTKEKYTFDLSPYSLIQHTEELENSYKNTYPSRRIDIDVENDLCNDQNALEEFKEINGWLVCFVSGEGTIIAEDDYTVSPNGKLINEQLYLPYKIYLAPMKNIQVKGIDGTYRNWSASTLYEKYKNGTSDETTYSFSVLKRCPLENFRSSTKLQKNALFFYENDKLILDLSKYTSDETLEANQCLFISSEGSSEAFCLYFDIQKDKQIKKNAEDITLCNGDFENALKTDLKNILKEPKILKKPFTSFVIKDEDSEGYEMNLFDICSTNIKSKSINCIETTSPESTKDFVSIKGSRINYCYEMFKDGIGFSKNNLFNLPVVDDAYKDYIRNNKNSALTGLGVPVMSAALGTALGAATGGLGLAIAGGTVINQVSNVANYTANMDNLKNTPDGIKNSGNNFLFSFLKGSVKDYIEVRELRTNDKETIFDYFYKYGYSVQRRLNSEDLFTRYIFNFIKSMENIEGKIETNNGIVLSNVVKNKISSIFEKGVTLWNVTEQIFNFDFENYESRLVESD